MRMTQTIYKPLRSWVTPQLQVGLSPPSPSLIASDPPCPIKYASGQFPYTGFPTNLGNLTSFTYHLYTLMGIANVYQWDADAAYIAFIVFYAICFAVTWFVYIRESPSRLEGV